MATPAAPAPLSLDPDRLFPPDPGVRALARTFYEVTRALPIVSPHGHVDARLLRDDQPFADPITLLVAPDHYVTRLLHAVGVPLDVLGVGRARLTEDDARRGWRELCSHWHVLAGTPVRTWLESELVELFGVEQRPSAETADDLYDHVASCLADPAFRPRALFERFHLAVLATTDDPCDDLAAHDDLAADPTWTGRLVPTFRPDAYLEVAQPGWPRLAARLAEVADVDTGTYAGFVAALEARRRAFLARGATATDHSHLDAGTEPLSSVDAERIYRAALVGSASRSEGIAFRRHMVFEMARMSCDDGLVMAVHPGVHRGHHPPTVARFGPDTGSDVPVRLELTEALAPLLGRFGTAAGYHLVVFTVDETVWSRELAPLAGFYPAVWVGAPWWFLDAPEAIRRFRAAVTPVAGFAKTAGFVDDTRAFCSIPARHDLARRVDAGILAGLVAEHRLAEDEALALATELVTDLPVAAFKL